MGLQKEKRKMRINLANLSNISNQARAITFNPTNERRQYSGTIQSISQNGMFIISRQIPQRGSHVFLSFPIKNRRVKCQGKVTFTKTEPNGNQPKGFGVRFTQVMDLDFDSIKKALRNSFSF